MDQQTTHLGNESRVFRSSDACESFGVLRSTVTSPLALRPIRAEILVDVLLVVVAVIGGSGMAFG